MRPTRRKLRWILLCVAVLSFLAYGLHAPKYARFTLSYRGKPPQVPQTFTIHEQWWPRRKIPFVSQRWSGLMDGGFHEKVEVRRRTLSGTPSGLSGQINRKRFFSLGDYFLPVPVVESEFDASQPQATWHTFSGGGDREPRVEKGVTRTDYHFLDVAASASTFRVPILWENGTRDAEITIDLDPIIYTTFLDVHSHPDWQQRGNRCSNAGPSYLLSLHVPRTLKYETFMLPPPGPGQAEPRRSGDAEVFALVEADTWMKNERPTPAEWATLKSQATRLDILRVKHDSVQRTVTLEVTSPPVKGDPLDKEGVVVLIGTPSTDGRWFGADCVRLKVEGRDSFNPIVYTVLEGLPNRNDTRSEDWGTLCSNPADPRVHVQPGKATTIRYDTTVRQSSPDPEIGQPIPSPRGDAEAFLVKVEDLAKLSERADDAEWDALRKKAIQPKGVKLRHRPGEKTIALELPDPAPADLALVVGTRSSDHRFFGFDCVRIDPTPARATVYTVLDGFGGREDRMRWPDQGTLCSDPKSPRLHIEPGPPTTLRYHTTVRRSSPEAEAEQSTPSPVGDAEVFLVKVEDLAKLSERVDAKEWVALREKAIQPSGLLLSHQPEEKTIVFGVSFGFPKDLALVVGTHGTGGRSFGFDCVRIDPTPAPAATP